MSSRVRKVTVLLLLALGVQLWLLWRDGIWGSDLTVISGLIAFVFAVIPAVRRRLWRAFNHVRHPSPRTRGIVACAIAAAASIYFYITASWQGRSLHPRSHDEFMYLLQARMLSIGRLWMPPLPHGDFFDTFYVFVEPVYASLTWPGTAMLWVPGMWLSLPCWVMPLIVAGAGVGLLYSVATQLFDGLFGLLAALALVALPLLRTQALTAHAQVPILMQGLLLAWAWLRWRASPSVRNAMFIGAIAGWAAITRPVDALCLALPVGIAMLSVWVHSDTRNKLKTAGAVVAGAAPFLALQLVFNVGVTGKLTKTPFTSYNDRDQPMLQYGFPSYDPAVKLETKLLQKRLLYEKFVLPAAEKHSPRQIPSRLRSQLLTTLDYNLPSPLLLALIPVGVLQLFRRQRFVVWAVLPVFLALYTGYALFLLHYTLLAAPAVIFMILAGVRAIERNFRFVSPACSLAVAAMCISVLPEFSRRRPDVLPPMPTMQFATLELPRLVRPPALILFRFHPDLNYHDEPVYNIDTAWPDDAAVIRAHDLGAEKNMELVRYYAARQPDRRVYTVDRRDLSSLHFIGRAGEVSESDLSRESAAAPPATRPATPPPMTVPPQ
ncbi:MAG: hypothetical protein M3478_06855 [Planctomycetota bacterium]|nr:hypothetical protein [Planctomycetota bacterium]